MSLQPQSDNQCSSSSPDFVEIRNGGEPFAPLLWRGCGGDAPPTIRSMSNKLWIGNNFKLHKSLLTIHRKFNATIFR